ncbi:killer cell lectin-like receptor 2 isoform X2 [Tamandua tetradactyla]|uniref:killer cell lectin-like receptor 2 isoform X2 n=1 Tax=Tamandua tetradactyla TaxID=48850 RepID=UPI004054466C
MSDQEVIYSVLSFLQSPAESQNTLRPAGTQRPGNTNGKECSVPWHFVAVTLGTLCLLLLIAVTVMGAMIFQYIQEKHQQEEILLNLRKNYHILQNDSYLKEQLLTNKTLEYDSFKNEVLQQKQELDSLFEKKNICHRKPGNSSESLQNTGKLWEEEWFCCGITCYLFITGNKTWKECQQTCQKYKSSLLKIDDPAELVFVRSQIYRNNYWIGLSYNEKDHKWRWVDNSTSSEIND